MQNMRGAIGKIVVQGPAKDVIKAVVHGRSAHAGLAPEKGISAIQVAARAIDKMTLLRIDEETTANSAISGGMATNIVADQVEVVAGLAACSTKNSTNRAAT